MRRRTGFLVGVIGAAAVAAMIAALWPREREPAYGGKRLSVWLRIAEHSAKTTEEYEQCQDAVERIGTNALPICLEWIRYETPGWRKRIMFSVPFRFRERHFILRLSGEAAGERYGFAQRVFELLGERGAPAIPALEALAMDRIRTNAAGRAVWALAVIGPAAVPALDRAMGNPAVDSNCRFFATQIVGLRRDLSAGERMRFLRNRLGDVSLDVRRTAEWQLERGRMGGVGNGVGD